MITSTSNKKIKELVAMVKKNSIGKKKNAYIIEGIRMFCELKPEEILEVFVSESFENENTRHLRESWRLQKEKSIHLRVY